MANTKWKYRFKYAAMGKCTVTVRAYDQRLAREAAIKELRRRYKSNGWPIPISWNLEIVESNDPIWDR